MLKSIICLGFAVLTTAQWAFTVPDGDLGEVAPGNNVRQGAIHNFKWQVGLGNEPVKVLDDEGHASLWITSGLDHSFNKLLATNVDSSSGGSWAWDTGTLSDGDIDLCQGVFIYRLQRPVSSDAATYDWDTPLEVSSVSFRILKKSDTGTTQAPASTTEAPEPVRQTTLITQTTVATFSAPQTSKDADSSTVESTTADPTASSERADTSTTMTTATTAAPNPTNTFASTTLSTIQSESSTSVSGSPTASATSAPPPADSGLSVGAKAGVGIGAVAAAALIAIAGLLLYWHPRKKGKTQEMAGGSMAGASAEKPHLTPTQQHEYAGNEWTDYPEVAQQQQHSGTPRAEMMGEGHGYGRHELPGQR